MHGKVALVVFTLVLVAGLLTGCSSGSSSTATSSSSGGTTATATTAKAAGAATAAKTSAAAGSGVCGKIALADAQALVPQTLSPVTDTGIGECLFHNAGQDVVIDYYTNDADQSSYKTISTGNDQQIAGIGDEAFWNEAVPGRTPPELAARKGNETCVIQSNDPPDTTLKTTPTASGFTVSDADALAYVQLMGKVCNDVFAAQ
jgi:hypothetical protein